MGSPHWRVALGQCLVPHIDKLHFGSVFDGCDVLRQGCILLGPPALRPLSELLDIVVQLLISCC